MKTKWKEGDSCVPSGYYDPPENEPCRACPTCGGETENEDGGGCDGDCRRGCKGNHGTPSACDDCLAKVDCLKCGAMVYQDDTDENGFCEKCFNALEVK